MVSVNLGRDSADDIKQFAQDKGAKFRIVVNNTPTDVVALYKVTGFPTNFVIDKEGKVVAKIIGADKAKLQAGLHKAGVL